jgi:hypothetical protein
LKARCRWPRYAKLGGHVRKNTQEKHKYARDTHSMQLACLYSIIHPCRVDFLESLVTLIDQAEPAFAQSSISRRIKALSVANKANSDRLCLAKYVSVVSGRRNALIVLIRIGLFDDIL